MWQRFIFDIRNPFFFLEATDKSVTEVIGRYLKEIEKLKARLIESEQMYQQLRKSTAQAARVKHVTPFGDTEGMYFTSSIPFPFTYS